MSSLQVHDGVAGGGACLDLPNRHGHHLERSLLLARLVIVTLSTRWGDRSAKTGTTSPRRNHATVPRCSGWLGEEFGLLEAGVGFAVGATWVHYGGAAGDGDVFFASHAVCLSVCLGY